MAAASRDARPWRNDSPPPLLQQRPRLATVLEAAIQGS